MPEFNLQAPFQPTGDQPQAIEKLLEGIKNGRKDQVLLGATGTGKTYTMANVIERSQLPALIIAHNKTLAAQLYAEFKSFFPENAVEYFVSYYDYYQPEAYVPHQDLYIEKETDINEEIDRLRLAATTALMSRKDVIIVASVSCIYGLGSPEAYGSVVSSQLATFTGGLIGLGAAIIAGWLIYNSTARLPVRHFFTVTSVLLLVFAAGLFAHALHEFQEAGWLPVFVEQVWNLKPVLDDESTGGAVLRVLVGYNDNPSLLEIVGYLGYWIAVLVSVNWWTNRRAVERRALISQA